MIYYRRNSVTYCDLHYRRHNVMWMTIYFQCFMLSMFAVRRFIVSVLVPIYQTLEIYVDRDSSGVTITVIITSCARGDTICLRRLQVDDIFAFIRQVAPVPAFWLYKTSATS